MQEKPFFELVSGYDDASLLPVRSTKNSAGYDFIVAEDTVIPSYLRGINILSVFAEDQHKKYFSLADASELTKEYDIKPTLVPTGIKACIPKDQYLQLSVRSSCPLKSWLILANGIGIIDSDYYNNKSNEGHIYFQIINLFPEDIILHKGDKIGQGVFLKYNTTIDDHASEERTGGFGSTSK